MTTISKMQLDALIRENKFAISRDSAILSRCSDAIDDQGRALSLPGADAGELTSLLAAGNEYGFNVNMAKAKSTIESLVGPQNFSVHSSHCAYFHHLLKEPNKFGIHQDDEQELKNTLRVAETSGPSYPMAAVLFITGNFGISPLYLYEFEGKGRTVQVLVYHQSLAKVRHRLMAKELIASEAVSLYNGLDAEYLYEVWDAEMEEQFYLHAGLVAQTAPIFEVNFKEDGTYKLVDLGFVTESVG